MCGLAGVARREPRGVATEMLDRMAAALRHRGPDGSGRYADAQVGLAHVRLSIIDVAGGAQPLGNEDGSVLIVYNGEIYNYLELQRELVAAGHRFGTRSDTEVLVHAYEQWGTILGGPATSDRVPRCVLPRAGDVRDVAPGRAASRSLLRARLP